MINSNIPVFMLESLSTQRKSFVIYIIGLAYVSLILYKYYNQGRTWHFASHSFGIF